MLWNHANWPSPVQVAERQESPPESPDVAPGAQVCPCLPVGTGGSRLTALSLFQNKVSEDLTSEGLVLSDGHCSQKKRAFLSLCSQADGANFINERFCIPFSKQAFSQPNNMALAGGVN